ncbi:unnamed protein product [Closterium sp. NIES-64]|nr:unnamed protein product [Closterium sp. NIES-64]
MTAGEPVFVLRTDPEGLGDAAEGFTGRDGGTPRVGISSNRAKHAKQLSRQQSPSRSRSPRNLPLRRLASTGSAAGASMSASPSLAHSTTITIGPPSPAASSASPSRGKNFPRATLGGGLGGRNSPSAGRRPFSATAAPGSSPKPPLSPSAAASGGNPQGEWELMWRDAVTRTEATARGLVGPLQRGAEEAPARIQRGVMDGAVAIGGVANAVKVRALATAKAAFGLLDRLDGDRLHCPRCKGSGLLSPSQAWSRLLRPAPSAANEPCWFCQGIGVMPIFDLSGFLVARCPPLVSSRHASSATLRFSSFQLFLGKFPGTRTRLVTSRLPRMLRHAIFAPALGPFCNASQDEAVRAFCSRGDPSTPSSSSSSSSASHGSESPASRTAATAAAAAAAAAAGSSAAPGSALPPLSFGQSSQESQDKSPKSSPRRSKWQQQQRQQEQQQGREGSAQLAQEQPQQKRRRQGGGGCSGGRSRGRRGGSGGRLGSSQLSPQPTSASNNSNIINSSSSSSATVSPGRGDQTARHRSVAANTPSADTSSIWGALSSPLRPGTPGSARTPGSPQTSGTTTPMAAAGALSSSTAGAGGAGDGSGLDEEAAGGAGEYWAAGGGGEIGQQSPRSRSPRRERNKVREKAERQAVERARVMQRSSSGRGSSAGIGEAAEALEGDSQGGANDLWWIVGARIRAAGSSFAPSMDFPSSHSTSFSLIPSTPRATQAGNTDSKKPSE